MSPRLPVFPLGTVLFPGLVLPLHIFEERYRELVRHLVALPDDTPREFGVVAIRRGWEAPLSTAPGASAPAADVSLHEVGCTAELRQVTELPDGRYDIVTVGRRRFRLNDVDTDSQPYLTGEVEWLPEPDGQEDLADLLAPRVLSVFRRYLRLMRADGASDDTLDLAEVSEQLPEDPTVLSHLVAATAALTVEDRQRLLAADDTATRLRAELRLLNREAALLGRVRAVPVPLAELAVPISAN
ncbi:LON peptidase substrate-binding domain-containing protein [Phytohabitans kaempferiae]|uniref:LON peptidase substrate-binding domain-containing protein n=1 Tax=Phytohabitans kaempferiae TaxID=1620943 RepID=A0ABV6M2W0_9ACTN